MFNFIKRYFGATTIARVILARPAYMSTVKPGHDITESILTDIQRGELKFYCKSIRSHISRDVHWKSECGRVKFRIDYPDMMIGSFSYAFIDDIDNEDVDIARIATVLNGRTDPGKSKLSLFWM